LRQFGMALQVRFAGQAPGLLPCLVAGMRPVVIQRGFDADAEAAVRQASQSSAHG